jgi:hypothetical protein
MKYSVLILLTILNLSACDSSKQSNKNTAKPALKATQTETKKSQEPKPHTITLKEVSRIALLQAKQIMENAQQSKIDISSALPTYEKAKKEFAQGNYKKAQVLAVEFRQLIESLEIKK